MSSSSGGSSVNIDEIIEKVIERVLSIIFGAIVGGLLEIGRVITGAIVFLWFGSESTVGIVGVPRATADLLTDAGLLVGSSILGLIGDVAVGIYGLASVTGPFAPIVGSLLLVVVSIVALWLTYSLLRVIPYVGPVVEVAGGAVRSILGGIFT